jgi:hypothetical protein
VPEERLDQPGVGAFVGQGIAGGVPQHVRMHVHVQLGRLPRLPDDVLQGIHRQRAATLGLEHLQPGDVLAELPQVAQFVTVSAVIFPLRLRWQTKIQTRHAVVDTQQERFQSRKLLSMAKRVQLRMSVDTTTATACYRTAGDRLHHGRRMACDTRAEAGRLRPLKPALPHVNKLGREPPDQWLRIRSRWRPAGRKRLALDKTGLTGCSSPTRNSYQWYGEGRSG